jgi:hypothetical protein
MRNYGRKGTSQGNKTSQGLKVTIQKTKLEKVEISRLSRQEFFISNANLNVISALLMGLWRQ